MKTHWGEKRYYSLDYYLKETYGEKIYKIALNGGMTCPNRDGAIGTRGCVFCSGGGSGEFTPDKNMTITRQIEEGKALIGNKYTGESYIAYFQAFTNTYAPVPYLSSIFSEAISHPDIKILSIATRPDCLDRGVLDLLTSLNREKPVWVELGLQTIHDPTASFIRRGYPQSVFDQAVSRLRAAGIHVIAHTILGLPGEDVSMLLDTVHYLNQLGIQGIKFQMLQILKNTDLETYYRLHPFQIPSMYEYFDLLGRCIANLKTDIVVHRLTGDPPKSLLAAPAWTANKRLVLNQFNSYLKKHDICQGKEL